MDLSLSLCLSRNLTLYYITTGLSVSTTAIGVSRVTYEITKRNTELHLIPPRSNIQRPKCMD